jgi:hypothetical protein
MSAHSFESSNEIRNTFMSHGGPLCTAVGLAPEPIQINDLIKCRLGVRDEVTFGRIWQKCRGIGMSFQADEKKFVTLQETIEEIASSVTFKE